MSARDELAKEAPDVAEALDKDTEELARKVQELICEERVRIRSQVRTEERHRILNVGAVLLFQHLLDAHEDEAVFMPEVAEAVRHWLEAPGFRGALMVFGHRIYPPSTESL